MKEGKIEKALYALSGSSVSSERAASVSNALAKTLTVILYIGILLSVPLDSLGKLIWFTIFPIICSVLSGLSYGKIFLRSLVVLPFVVFIGVFNPVYDRTPEFTVGAYIVSRGWVTFLSIIIRGLLAVQAVIILNGLIGFNGICRSLRKAGVPSFLTSQLLFVHRYLGVLLEEVLTMKRAVASRGFGKKNLPLRLWGTFVGQLFLRTLARSETINRAMLARGFKGIMPEFCDNDDSGKWSFSDFLYLALWTCVFISLRFIDMSVLVGSLMERTVN